MESPVARDNNKVEINEVTLFSNELRSAAASLQSSLEIIKSNIDAIEQMDSFKGKAADSAKIYFKKFHSFILQFFSDLYTELDSSLSSHIAIFHSDVDSSGSALIDGVYLKDHNDNIINQYRGIDDSAGQIKKTINGISDISSVSSPSLSAVNSNFLEVTQYIQNVEIKLDSFTAIGAHDYDKQHSQLKDLEKYISGVGKLKGKDRFSNYYVALNNIKGIKDMVKTFLKNGKTITDGFLASWAIGIAAAKKGLRTEIVIRNGKKYYRILATEEAMKHFGIKPDKEAERAFKESLRKYGKAEARIKYATNKPGSSGWSKVGDSAIGNYSPLQYWSGDYRVGVINKVKTVGTATLKGTVKSFKDIFAVKSIAKEIATSPTLKTTLKSASKGIAPVSAGLSWYSNYTDAQNKGFNTAKAVTSATIDTGIDTAVGGAVQTFFTAAGTALIPIPGVGTFFGVTAGIYANMLLNAKHGKDKKSVMDRVKGWFH